jgi:sensor histidine kinase regulating citrate/malate metabolism
VRLALRLLVVLFLLLLVVSFLCLVILIIRTLSNQVTSLTAFEAGALSPYFVLVGVLLASLKCGLEALDDKRRLILIEASSLHLCHLAWKRLPATSCLKSNRLRLVDG